MREKTGVCFFFQGLKPAELQPCSCPETRNVEGPSKREGNRVGTASHRTASLQAAWLSPVCQAFLVAEEQRFLLTKWKFLMM